MADPSDRLLTVREVAERVKANEVTVQRWLRSGRLKGTRPGGTRLGWRIPESELRRFLTESEPTSHLDAGATLDDR